MWSHRLECLAASTLLGIALPLLALAQPAPFDPSSVAELDHARRGAIIDSISVALKEVYIFEDVANEMAALVSENWKSRKYDDVSRIDDFVERLTRDLQSVSHDKHLRVRVEAPGGETDDELAQRERWERMREQARRANYHFRKLEILEGNIGYLRFDEFAPAEVAGETVVAAMKFVENTDALIFDLRRNGGGSPSLIQLITSYLFEDPQHLNSFYIRQTDETRQFWTQAFVDGHRMPDVPVFVLTSGYTFSGAEEFSYNLKNMERATIVGETTGGGAHPVQFHWFGFDEYNVTMSLPYGRAINPITGTNWEGTGVEPNIKCDAAEALDVAMLEALKRLSEAADEARRAQLAWAIEGVEAKRNPPRLTPADLKLYPGRYGPRTVWLDGDRLWYQREGRPKTRMLPIGRHRFELQDVDGFRVEFVVSGKQAAELVGHYPGGRTDRNARSDG